MSTEGKDEFDPDTCAIMYADAWVIVLAAPHIYRSLKRAVEPEVILKLLDVWIARGDRMGPEPEWWGTGFDGGAARKLRALVAAWKPPELPAEITEAARAFLRGIGRTQPHAGGTWDDYSFDLTETRTLESLLIWSEGVNKILPENLSAPGAVGGKGCE